MIQAGVYASLLPYFKEIDAIGSARNDGIKVVEKMKSWPTEGLAFGKGKIERNGRKVHPAYLFEAKAPSESKAP